MSHETIPLMKDTEDDIEHGVMFVHSPCCNAHWEVYLRNDGSGGIQCEKCGAHVVESLVKIVHKVEVEECQCSVCNKPIGDKDKELVQ